MNLKKILLFLNILLSGLVLWMGFNIYETWASHKNIEKKPITEVLESGEKEEAGPEKSERRNDYRLIVSRDIFKTKTVPAPAKEKSAQKQKPEELKENTSFELMGTVVGEDGKSFAIIRKKNKKEQEIYALDDYVEDAKIAEILSDRVIVERTGAQEVLVISHERGAARRLSVSSERKFAPTPRARRTVRKRPVRPVRASVTSKQMEQPEDLERPEESERPEEPERSEEPERPEDPDT